MPPHRVYIESHLGGGAILRSKKPAPISYAIDADPRVIGNFRQNHSSLAEYQEMDAVEFLKAYQFSGDELVYSDPPYPKSTRLKQKIYRCEYEDADHEELLETLISLPCQVMVSSYENTLYSSMLKGWNEVKFPNKTQTGIRIESLWTNYPKPKEVHDTRYLGGTFRERQTIRRKQERLRNKISALPTYERQALFEWISEAY
ncbi:hypothetical protein QEH59_12450 [Coraliomargarita sp. SDUM461004]|uniref:DNA adenine methylase n=1 Tax=Thalassobacterium sedimentorum TaxID=3041258 RepID=A0ABU1AKC0_9BACT|nr:hypothetical protein [Coraliomargarita sp. SDUM461004]MDQ8195241.1 hypothetical protein [Coraliomargarita sp. SDUM461004]